MHDPMTVAFTVPRPWPHIKRPPNGKRHVEWPAMITIWHVDPETDGSDDSCGWARPPLSDADKTLAAEIADWDARWPYYFVQRAGPGDTVALVFSLFQTFAWRLERRRLSARDLRCVFELAATESDNVQRLFRPDESPHDRRRTIRLMLAHYRALRRPWWRQPRWHVHHWRIQWHFGQTLRRYLLTRCARCGRRFAWGEAPVSESWDPERDPWWRGERGLRHSTCRNRKGAAARQG